MVAVAGTGWKLAPSLVAYVLEADRVFPQRDRSADGSIGDLAHQARVSDHNPAGDGLVHAVDLDEDLAPGLDMRGFAERLRLGRDRRIKYVIYEGRMFSSYATATRRAWEWGPYSGVNAHLHHLHLSILNSDTAENDVSPWGFAPTSSPQETDELMAAADDILEAIAVVRTKVERTFNQVNLRTGSLANAIAALAAQGDDVDEAALAAALAPHLSDSLAHLSDADLAAIAAAVNDEHARRAAA